MEPKDDEERIHAAIYVVFDERHSFYLVGGGDPKRRNSGAHSLLMWRAIQDAASRSRVFDFEGSMIAPVARFFRAFGAQQTLRVTAKRASLAYKLADGLRRWVGRR